jgi:hypothetical protein
MEDRIYHSKFYGKGDGGMQFRRRMSLAETGGLRLHWKNYEMLGENDPG